jgi:hypothetical protein
MAGRTTKRTGLIVPKPTDLLFLDPRAYFRDTVRNGEQLKIGVFAMR